MSKDRLKVTYVGEYLKKRFTNLSVKETLDIAYDIVELVDAANALNEKESISLEELQRKLRET